MQRTPGPAGRSRAASEFARRARERVARGEPLTVAVGGTEVVLPADLRHAVLSLLEASAEGVTDPAPPAAPVARVGAGGSGGPPTGAGAGAAAAGAGPVPPGGRPGDERVPSEPLARGLPPLPLRLPPQLTPGQAADLLGVSRAAVAQMIDRGELAAGRDGARRRLATADVLALRDTVRGRRSASVSDVVAASVDLDLYPRGPAGPTVGGR
jgi:excisionase family DNA binding protein